MKTDKKQGEAADDSSQAEQLTTENERLRRELGIEKAKRLITNELTAAGARSPELLFGTLVESIEFDEKGEPANTATLVGGLKTKHPEQFGTQTASIDAGAGMTAKPALTREALGRMKPAEIAKLDWAAVREVLSQNN
ncbi:MAG TPA: hypothetical protein PKA82_01760 [Pyrinomonadaceae bacterium]|nr:hypothetical protein [Pyrinomonadaceae bacterium]